MRDFVHVNDLVNCVVDIVNGKISPGEYEIGTGIGTSINDLIKKVEFITILIPSSSFMGFFGNGFFANRDGASFRRKG